ncbi:MAG: lipase family protein [Acidobacteriia bacterium]|nr:lipase family protein [Terriglobia bacterium]
MAGLPEGTTAISAVTLSAIAYADGATDGSSKQKSSIVEDLKSVGPLAEGPWSLVWGPAASGGNMALVAINSRSSRYALSLRGEVRSDPWASLQSLLHEADPLSQSDWHYPLNSEIRIAACFAEALRNLIAMTDPATGWSLLDFLRKTMTGSRGELMVTGHGLGGTLATMAALWLHDQMPKGGGPGNVKILPITFAAPTAGNQAFANRFDETFSDSVRYVNGNDPIPMAYAGIARLLDCFPDPGAQLRAFVGNLIYESLFMLAPMLAAPTYRHTNQRKGTIILQGPPVVSTNTFPQEVAVQHDVMTYLRIMMSAEIPA